MRAMSIHRSRPSRRPARPLPPTLLPLALLGLVTAGALAGGTPAHAATGPTVFVAELTGAAEDPPVASPATGSARVVVDPVAHTMRVQFDFDGLTAGLTAAHIHACTATPLVGNAAVATQTPTFVGTPTGMTSGSYDQTFDTIDADTYNASFVTSAGSPEAAETALLACLELGGAYLNLHSSAFPAGEIRGFLLIDTDDDGTADATDLDDDGDGQTDVDEDECGSDPLDPASTSPDADDDGVPDCVDPTPDTTTTAAPTTTAGPTTTTASTPTTAPAAGAPTTVPGPTSTSVAPSGTLPSTGHASSGTAAGALLLIVAGAWLVHATRRPRHD